MPEYSRDQLRSIKTFPQLVKYLRDELEWPVETDSFEDLTFDYEPSELGIDTKTAAKIDSIKQLRPLVTGQPWGIFFVKFEPKRLPVVALRRILSQLVVKKRASALTSERAAWNLHDLLFISNYGEGEERQITFAQFSQDHTTADLPTLKVLGWDDSDTVLHIDHVHETLNERLHWPEDDSDLKKWREQWSAAFTIRHREVITTSKDLAIRLADLARGIRRRAGQVLAIETDRGHLRKLHKAFKEALIHDLSEGDFADMYAQTIAYGLLAARVSRPMGIIADNVADMVPITNPFLKEMLGTFLTVGGRKGKIDFDELGIQDVVELLNSPDTHMEAILRDFGRQVRQEDPVIHFYELFLREYDSAMKVKRGVFYTPQPVVSYIVRSVHELLQTEFGLEDGLASTLTWGEMAKKFPSKGEGGVKIPDGVSPDEPFVLILDPATGTATFIVEVIDVIHKTMVAKWKKAGKPDAQIQAAWNEYVPKHLLPRIYGYELMMAPYAIAHMKVGLKLFETGYRFGSEERVHIYLTNALEPPHGVSGQLELMAPSLAHEAKAVNAVKSKKRFTVIVGNPPYSGHSANVGEWITQLVDAYYYVDGKPLGEKNSKWLQDDYVKFIRLGQHFIKQAGVGILSYITNHGYIDNPTFRGMRQSLLHSFNAIKVLDLHGNTTKKERAPDGDKDVNVFDIKQGVAIFAAQSLMCSDDKDAVVRHSDLFGSRESKYDALLKTTFSNVPLPPTHPASPFYLFVPQDLALRTEYDSFLPITSVMPVNVLGFQTHRDEIAVAIGEAQLKQQIAHFMGMQPKNDDWASFCSRCSYRLFDLRMVYLSPNVCDRPRRELLTHVVHRNNLCLGVGRQGIAVQDPVWSLVSVSKYPVDANIFRRGGINIFPLYLYEDHESLGLHKGRHLNFGQQFLNTLASVLALEQKSKGGIPSGLAPEDILHYAYALFHSPIFRTRYAEFLKIDFPRLPLTSSLDLFQALGNLGGELVALHLMESEKLNKFITKYVGRTPSGEVEKITYSDETVWIDKAKSQGFRGVPEEVWNFHIGGYQVCYKWLKDRKGRSLSADDIQHYQKIVVSLHETIRIMAEIDKVIDQHGGWPGAFQGSGE